MTISGTGASPAWPVAKSTSTGMRAETAPKATASASADQATGNFLKYAKMSPMERMRAGILKSLNLTEEKLSALPQEAQRKIEDQIKDQVKKLLAKSGGKDQLVDILA